MAHVASAAMRCAVPKVWNQPLLDYSSEKLNLRWIHNRVELPVATKHLSLKSAERNALSGEYTDCAAETRRERSVRARGGQDVRCGFILLRQTLAVNTPPLRRQSRATKFEAPGSLPGSTQIGSMRIGCPTALDDQSQASQIGALIDERNRGRGA